MHTIKQIIVNQRRYRKPMLKWLSQDLRESKKKLVSINSDDEYISEQVEKLKGKFKKTTYKKEIDKLFFIHPKRSIYFTLWQKIEKELYQS